MRHQIAMNGYNFVSNFPDDQEAFMVMEKIFLKAFGISRSLEEDDIEKKRLIQSMSKSTGY
jgi:hypothetical protein